MWSKDKDRRKVSLTTIAVAGAILLAVAFFSSWGIIYFFHDTSGVARGISRVVPYPAIVIASSSVVPYSDIVENMRAVKKFYVSQDFASQGMRVDFTTPDGVKRLKMKEKDLLNKLIEDRFIERYVRENGRQVTETEVSQNIDRLLAETGGLGSAPDNLETLYGWDMGEFGQRVVLPELYREKAEIIFREKGKEDPRYREARRKIDEAAGEIVSGKKTFAEAAKSHSEGSTAADSGRIGWVKPQNIDVAVANMLPSLKVGQRSEIIEGTFGFHIILLNQSKRQGDDTFYDISQIFVRKPLLADLISERLKGSRVWVALPEYRWNSGTGFVEFSDSSLREFEEKQGSSVEEGDDVPQSGASGDANGR